ncbi:MAG: hypothetical protein IPP67_09560 [Rhodospirillaceae bacterium]|nr:hypothetical protein [Rhodospirillaceae bacterium]
MAHIITSANSVQEAAQLAEQATKKIRFDWQETV